MTAPSAEEKLRNELLLFESAVTDGFELYTTGRSVVQYFFGKKSLLEAFSRAWSDASLRAELSDIAERLVFVVERELQRHLHNQFNKGMWFEEQTIFIRRLAVFWHLCELQSVEGLLSEDTVNRMQKALGDVDTMLLTFKDKHRLRELPEGLHHALENLALYDRFDKSQQSRLGRDEASIYSTDVDTSVDEEVEDEWTGGVVAAISGILDEFKAGSYASSRVQELEKVRGGPLAYGHHYDLMNRLFGVWSTLQSNEDVRMHDSALRLLRVLLFLSPRRDTTVHNFHEFHLKTYGALPSYKLDGNKKQTTAFVNSLTTVENMQKEVERAEETLNEFHWLALVSPVEVSQRMLQHSFADRRIVATVHKFLATLPSLSALLSPETGDFLLLSILLSIGTTADLSLAEERDALVYLVVSMTRQKRRHDVVESGAIVSAGMVWRAFVKAALFSHDAKRELFALSLLCRLCAAGETKASVFCFTRAIKEQITNDNIVRAPELMLSLVDMMTENQQKKGSREVFEAAKKTLKQLGHKLKDDDVVFEGSTIDRILCHLGRLQWFVKVAIIEWFASTLGDPMRQIPSGLFCSLSSEGTQRFEQIVVAFDFCPTECFFRSLLEAALWDLPFALTFLERGVCIQPSDDNLCEKLALSIVDVAGEGVQEGQGQGGDRLANFIPLISKLLTILDISIDVHIERINVAVYQSIESQRPLHIVAKAAKLALLTDPADPRGYDLLQLFCSAAKAHLDKEMDSWRKNQKLLARGEPLKREDEETWRLARRSAYSEAALSQCSTLFPIAVAFTHLVAKTPAYLQTLLSSIADNLSEFYVRPPIKSLDSAPTGSVPDTTVYAYSKMSGGDTIAKENGSSHSVSNPLFDKTNGKEMALSTARAINDTTTAAMVERKLTSVASEEREGKDGRKDEGRQTGGGYLSNFYKKKKGKK